LRASEPAGEILTLALNAERGQGKDLEADLLLKGLVDAAGIELEPLCGRLSPQAKS
jgi:hypothetical protein